MAEHARTLTDVTNNMIAAIAARVMQLQKGEQYLCQNKDLERVHGFIDGVSVSLIEGWKEEKALCWYPSGRRYASQELRWLDAQSENASLGSNR